MIWQHHASAAGRHVGVGVARRIRPHRDIPTRRAVDKLLRDAGAQVQITTELDNVETVKRAVEIGLGISILPRAACQQELLRGSLVAVPISDGDFTRPISVLVRRGRSLSRAAEAFLEVLVGQEGLETIKAEQK